MAIKLSDLYKRIWKTYLESKANVITEQLVLDAGRSILRKILNKENYTWRFQLVDEETVAYTDTDNDYLTVDSSKISKISDLFINSNDPANRYYPMSKDYFDSYYKPINTNNYLTDTNGIYYSNVKKVYCYEKAINKIYLKPMPTSAVDFLMSYKKEIEITNIDTEIDIPDSFEMVFIYGIVYKLSAKAKKTAIFRAGYKDDYKEELSTQYDKYSVVIDKDPGQSTDSDIAVMNSFGINN